MHESIGSQKGKDIGQLFVACQDLFRVLVLTKLQPHVWVKEITVAYVGCVKQLPIVSSDFKASIHVFDRQYGEGD